MRYLGDIFKEMRVREEGEIWKTWVFSKYPFGKQKWLFCIWKPLGTWKQVKVPVSKITQCSWLPSIQTLWAPSTAQSWAGGGHCRRDGAYFHNKRREHLPSCSLGGPILGTRRTGQQSSRGPCQQGTIRASAKGQMALCQSHDTFWNCFKHGTYGVIWCAVIGNW